MLRGVGTDLVRVPPSRGRPRAVVGRPPDADGQGCVGGVELVDCEVIRACIVIDAVDEVVLIHDHRRGVAVATGRDDESCTGAATSTTAKAVQRVAVHPDHRLVVEWGRLATGESSGSRRPRRAQRPEHAVRLGAPEVVDVHREQHPWPPLSRLMPRA